jgi:hypothetical protein
MSYSAYASALTSVRNEVHIRRRLVFKQYQLLLVHELLQQAEQVTLAIKHEGPHTPHYEQARVNNQVMGTDTLLVTVEFLNFGPIEKILCFFVTSACARRTDAATRVERRRRER